MADLFAALIHHPVVDRTGAIVTSAVTSLDLHDLARAARTYDVRAVFVVHPIPESAKIRAKPNRPLAIRFRPRPRFAPTPRR